MSIALPDRAAPENWPWLDWKITTLLLLALFLGLLSFAAVGDLTIKCSDEPIYLNTESGGRLMLEDGSGFLVLEQKRRVCRLAAGKAFAI